MEGLQSAIATLDGIIDALERPASSTPEYNGVAAGHGEVRNSESAGTAGTKEKKKKTRAPSASVAPLVPDEVAQFLMCDFRVGKIVEVGHHPEAEALYALKIDVGNGEIRSVCAGLRGFVTDNELSDRLVLLICNLKPRKLRGVDSQAMCMAGSTKSEGGGKERVVPVSPPPGAQVGTLVSVGGVDGDRTVVDGKFLSGKVWDKVVSRLSVMNGKACYNGSPLVAGASGYLGCALPDGSEIH